MDEGDDSRTENLKSKSQEYNGLEKVMKTHSSSMHELSKG